jgi:hypothetical protein
MYAEALLRFLRIVRQHVNQTFGEQWTGRGGPVNWPSQCPELNTLEVLAVGTAKDFNVLIANQ